VTPYRPTRSARIVNNLLYFALQSIRNSFVVFWLAVWMFGFVNVLLFCYSCGIAGTVFWEIERVRERRRMQAAVLHYFGVPENVEFPALK